MKKLFLVCSFGCIAFLCFGQQPTSDSTVVPKEEISQPAKAKKKGYAVLLDKDTLFKVYGNLGPYTAEERAVSINTRLNQMLDKKSFSVDSLYINESENGYDIRFNQRIVMTITRHEAEVEGKTLEATANGYYQTLKDKLRPHKNRRDVWGLVREIGLTLLVVLVLFFIVRILNRLFKKFVIKMVRRGESSFKGLNFKNFEFLSPKTQFSIILNAIKVLKWVIILLLIYLSLPILFSIFPGTEGIANKLIGYILTPLKRIFAGIFGYIPNLITIAVIFTVTYYFVKFLKRVSREIEAERLVINGFYSDWAMPTFNILRFVLYAFMFIMIFPYLPGSNSPVFQGVSVFLGLLVSLGSSSAISNVIAGLVITYMRPFKIGERVKIGDTTGDVLAKTLLVTRMRTIKNEDITIPNANILTGHTINYSSSAKELGLILNTTVTIGYDVPWKTVQQLLIDSALKCEHIKKEPTPFVLQTSLDDFYVSYQLNAYTEKASMGAKIYSELHQNIQDLFNEAGVEILSPHYRAARDGNMVTIPANYLPPDYKAPSFRVENTAKNKT